MPETLLQTKLYIPTLRSNLVPRPRLIERLNQGLERNYKLTLICAPAGFGKTTLISDWIQESKRTGRRIGGAKLSPSSLALNPSNVVWLSLDENDNDPTRFLTYFGAALNQADSGFGQDIEAMLSSSQPAVVEPFIRAIVNDIATSDPSVSMVCVLEDYHFINSPAIHDALVYLLDNLPAQMHLVMTSRSDPPLALSRLRARNQLMEIRARDLRFTTRETTEFLNETMGLNLGAETVSTFEQRTEGWIAGLQLAALSMQQHEDPLSYISAFAGDDRYVADYLMEEVFNQRPASTRKFLLSTSILESLNAALCDAVIGDDNSQTILNELETSNLFIVPLDNQRHWYRYHHLFADLLRQRLEASSNISEIGALHQRASRWYEENGSLVAAVEHALSARDYQRAIRLIEQHEDEIFQGSRLTALLGWWTEIPLEVIESRPKLCMIYSWAWLATGHPEESEGCLQAIERSQGAALDGLFAGGAESGSLAPAARAALIEVAVVRAQIAIQRGELSKALELSLLILPYLVEDEQPFLLNPPIDSRMTVFFNVGLVYKAQGALGAAEDALSRAASLGSDQKNIHIASVAFGQLANVQTIRGELNKVEQTCQRGLTIIHDMAGGSSPMSGRLQVELGALRYERNDLEEARHHLQEGIEVARPWGYMDALLQGYTGLARLRAVDGNWTEAFALLDELSMLSKGYPEFLEALNAFRTRLWTRQGNVKAAGMWAETSGLQDDGKLSYRREEVNIVLARVLMAQQKWNEADRLIERLLEATENGERWSRLIELLILRALLADAQDKPNEAVEHISRALTLAEPQGYVRIFVDEGEPMAQLLYRAIAHGITPGYTGKLLASFQDSESVPVPPADIQEPKPGLIEPLSVREIEVLDCLAEGLSNREIAQRLTISLTTVKTHTRNIYRKLDVNSRTQAVARGKALGIGQTR